MHCKQLSNAALLATQFAHQKERTLPLQQQYTTTLEQAEARAVQVHDLELALAQSQAKCGARQSLAGELPGHIEKRETPEMGK